MNELTALFMARLIGQDVAGRPINPATWQRHLRCYREWRRVVVALGRREAVLAAAEGVLSHTRAQAHNEGV
jgi:hypothetical protein